MSKITRRSALLSGLSLAGASTITQAKEPLSPSITFQHGIASGDPTPRSVIIWTRITSGAETTISGRWEVSKTPDFAKIKRHGNFTTDARRDYTVKIDVPRLKSGKTYFYRFRVGDITSETGRTKTLPKGELEQARFAVVSCSNFPFGFFNVYDHISKQDHYDAVIHLGDYLYEYSRKGYGGKVGEKIGRRHEPAHEILTLNDYRTRHAQYKADTATRALHAKHAMICIWDDHETANDSWKTGAQNHNDGEGSWDERRRAAMQAYYEWMPVRDPKQGAAREALFRTYNYGNLLTITAIETRLTARTQPLDYEDHVSQLRTKEGIMGFVKNDLWNPARELLGDAQRRYISTSLKSSKDKKRAWRVIANQVIMARTASPDLTPFKDADFINDIEKLFPAIRDFIALSPLGLPLNLDAWDGYPAARERFYATADAHNANDLLVLTGDTHESWANQLSTKEGKSMGVELGTPSVTSPGTGAYFGEAAPEFSRLLTEKNDDIIYHDLSYHGYIDLTLTPSSGHADFIGVSTIYSPKYEAEIRKSFKLVKSENSLALKEV
jgi:phosphodiesterase/alkaline phosphatase D-like protein